MILPLVNVFSSPYKAWNTRSATHAELQEHYGNCGEILFSVNDSLKALITSHRDAANYMANHGGDNGLESFVDSYLDRCKSYKSFRDAMPSKTPVALSEYQKKYPNYSVQKVDEEINMIGHTLSEGQVLFHGGLWADDNKDEITLTKPFSTSLCSQVALRNAEWRGKAFDAGRIDLFVLRAIYPRTNVFAFRRKGTNMGNEKEVLFASEAKLVLRNRSLIRSDYSVTNHNHKSKHVPIYIIDVDIS